MEVTNATTMPAIRDSTLADHVSNSQNNSARKNRTIYRGLIFEFILRPNRLIQLICLLQDPERQPLLQEK